MSNVHATTGTRIFIGPAVSSTLALADYAGLSLSFQEIAPVESISKFGDEAQEIKFTSLTDSRVRKNKGPRDAGSLTVVCGWDALDDGQQDLIAAEQTSSKYAFMVVLDDGSTDVASTTHIYFRALVSTDPYNPGSAGDTLRREYMLSIDSELYEVPAT